MVATRHTGGWLYCGLRPGWRVLSSAKTVSTPSFRYYKGHFKDIVRQCCLDMAQGQPLNELEAIDFWMGVRTLRGIASELVPLGDPKHMPHIALGPEFELAGALYHMTRSVASLVKNSLLIPVSHLSNFSIH